MKHTIIALFAALAACSQPDTAPSPQPRRSGFSQVVDLTHFASVRNDGAAYDTDVVETTLVGPQSVIDVAATTRILRLKGASSIALGGLGCGGVACGIADQGRLLKVDNATDYPATLVNENGATVAVSDRFVLASSVSRRLPPHTACDARFDGDSAGDLRWHFGFCGPRADCGADSVTVWTGTDDACAPLGQVAALAWGASWQSGRWYFNIGTGSSTLGLTQSSLRCSPVPVPNAATIDRIWLWITTPGEAGSKVRSGIYADDGTGRPGPLVADLGQVDGTISGAAQTPTITAVFSRRAQYWECVVAQSCPVTCPTMRTYANTPWSADSGTATPGDVNGTGFTMGGVTGALPNPFVVGSVATNPEVKFGVRPL